MTMLTKPPPSAASVAELPLRRFTAAEYYAMAEAGILKKEDKVELIDGIIIAMAPMGRNHRSTTNRYTRLFGERIRRRAIVQVQSSIFLDDRTMPEPDLVLLRERADFYESDDAGPEDVLLIKVADSSVGYDRNEKLPRYARAGIPEVWLTVLPEGVVEAHTEPTDDGYRVMRRFRAGDVLRPGCFEDIEIPVVAILPDRT